MLPSLPIEVADLGGGDWASCLLPRAVRADASTDAVHRFNARVPHFMTYRILHHPRVERADARNIALTFTRQPPMPELLPFAAGLTRYWSDRRLHACEAPT